MEEVFSAIVNIYDAVAAYIATYDLIVNQLVNGSVY